MPVETDEMREKLKADREALEATVTANLCRMLTKKSTDSHKDLLARDGHVDIHLSKNIDSMKEDRLKNVSKSR